STALFTAVKTTGNDSVGHRRACLATMNQECAFFGARYGTVMRRAKCRPKLMKGMQVCNLPLLKCSFLLLRLSLGYMLGTLLLEECLLWGFWRPRPSPWHSGGVLV